MSHLYSTRQVADACGVSIWTVTRYFRDTMPCKHYEGQWWRLTTEEFEVVCAVLKSAKLACPSQPLHAFKKSQSFLVFG